MNSKAILYTGLAVVGTVAMGAVMYNSTAPARDWVWEHITNSKGTVELSPEVKRKAAQRRAYNRKVELENKLHQNNAQNPPVTPPVTPPVNPVTPPDQAQAKPTTTNTTKPGKFSYIGPVGAVYNSNGQSTEFELASMQRGLPHLEPTYTLDKVLDQNTHTVKTRGVAVTPFGNDGRSDGANMHSYLRVMLSGNDTFTITMPTANTNATNVRGYLSPTMNPQEYRTALGNTLELDVAKLSKIMKPGEQKIITYCIAGDATNGAENPSVLFTLDIGYNGTSNYTPAAPAKPAPAKPVAKAAPQAAPAPVSAPTQASAPAVSTSSVSIDESVSTATEAPQPTTATPSAAVVDHIPCGYTGLTWHPIPFAAQGTRLDCYYLFKNLRLDNGQNTNAYQTPSVSIRE